MRVLLLSMPWAPAHRPSIQLGALSAFLRREEPRLTVSARHPSLAVVRTLGFPAYQHISDSSWAGEALYSGLLFPDRRQESLAVAGAQLGRRWPGPPLAFLQRQLAGQLEALADDPLVKASDLIGLSVCFSQFTASLAAARAIKARHPSIPIVLGGSSCTPRTAAPLLRLMPQIDYVVCGEGEKPLLSLCRCLLGDIADPGPNVLACGRKESAPVALADCQQLLLDQLPLPDYDDYFAEIARLGSNFFPELPLEFSRGCWWNRCAFCNLNLQWRGYRRKSAGRMEEEIHFLRQRHGCLDFSFTDNSLPPREADELFARLGDSGLDLRFFGEIRATLPPASFRTYARGGLRSVQIGIEALVDSLLERMDKGVRAIDNIAAMKQALAAGIAADGNLILEFPSSTEEEVAKTLLHLDFVLPYRPLKAAVFFLGQGSPVWQRPGDFGLGGRAVHPLVRRLFPPQFCRELEYLVQAPRGDRRVQRRRWRPVREKIASWRLFHRERPRQDLPALALRDGGDFLLLRQERPDGPPLHHRLRGVFRRIYLACDSPLPLKTLHQRFPELPPDTIDLFLSGMQAKRLLFCDGERVLALAVAEDRRQRTEGKNTPGKDLV